MRKPKRNLELRSFIVGQGVTYGEVAKQMYMSKSAFSQMLQKDLTEEQTAEIRNATNTIVILERHYERKKNEARENAEA